MLIELLRTRPGGEVIIAVGLPATPATAVQPNASGLVDFLTEKSIVTRCY